MAGAAGRRAAQVPRPPPAPVRRVGHAQVRDLLPVRAGLPDRVHRHGRHGHQGPLPRPLGPRRDVRRAARGVGAAPVRPDRAGRRVRPVRPRGHGRPRRDPRPPRLRPQGPARDPRGDAGRVRLPAGRRAQAHLADHRHVVRDDLRHRDLLPAPAVRAADDRGGAGGRGAPGRSSRPTGPRWRPRWASAARRAAHERVHRDPAGLPVDPHRTRRRAREGSRATSTRP